MWLRRIAYFVKDSCTQSGPKRLRRREVHASFEDFDQAIAQGRKIIKVWSPIELDENVDITDRIGFATGHRSVDAKTKHARAGKFRTMSLSSLEEVT